MLGDVAAAEDAARAAHELDDPVAFNRNYALGLVELAEALAQGRKLDEAADVVSRATAATADLDSARAARRLRAVTASLAA